MQTHMPREIIGDIKRCLGEHGMPTIATRHVEPGTHIVSENLHAGLFWHVAGMGFSCMLAGKRFEFPLVERAPPEIYLSRGYTSYALNHT